MLTFSPWAFLPPVFSASTAAGLWLVYVVALNNEAIVSLSSHSYRKRNGSFYPPYISIAGNSPPASCIFSEVMNLAAFVGFVIAVLRYLQLRQTGTRPWLNAACLAAFSAGCFGMTLVGNFQLFTQESIHNFGTFMTFGLGTLFCWVQSYITLKVDLNNEGKKVAAARFLLSGSITLCMVLHFSLMSQRLHMHAARCQWSLVMFFLLFLATFAVEFRHGRFHAAFSDTPGGETSRYQADHEL